LFKRVAGLVHARTESVRGSAFNVMSKIPVRRTKQGRPDRRIATGPTPSQIRRRCQQVLRARDANEVKCKQVLGERRRAIRDLLDENGVMTKSQLFAAADRLGIQSVEAQETLTMMLANDEAEKIGFEYRVQIRLKPRQGKGAQVEGIPGNDEVLRRFCMPRRAES